MSSNEEKHNGIEAFITFLNTIRENTKKVVRSESVKAVGNKLKLIDKNHLNYFIDFDVDKQLTENMIIVSDAIIDLFEDKEMIVTEIGLQKVYNCGHCDNEHIHDIVIFIPGLNKRYYVSSDAFEII